MTKSCLGLAIYLQKNAKLALAFYTVVKNHSIQHKSGKNHSSLTMICVILHPPYERRILSHLCKKQPELLDQLLSVILG
ncbi:MAG: hypothetical protein PUP92_38885 [Rhizonema sp. PD38]|nr:hypothetical protein [Rhizonema sp. PD38]